MGGWVRATGLMIAGCLAGVLLGHSLALSIRTEAPRVVKAPPTPAPRPQARLWYAHSNTYSPVLPDGQRYAVRSLLNITGPMHFGSFVWNEKNVPQGPVWVHVDLTRQLLSVFRGGHEIGSAVILYGAGGKPTPIGVFSVLEKNVDYHSRSYDAPMPYMLRLTEDGVAIHGSNVREGWATHGCIGVPPDFARLLFSAAKKGDVVEIVSQPKAIKANVHADNSNPNESLR